MIRERQHIPFATGLSGARASYDGGKGKKGSTVHLAVEPLGHLLPLHGTPTDADDRGDASSSGASAGSPAAAS